MTMDLTITLLSLAVVCVGLALLIPQVVVRQVLTVGGTVLAGVVFAMQLLG